MADRINGGETAEPLRAALSRPRSLMSDGSVRTRSFAHRLELFGDRPALLLESGQILTYADLAARADSFAAQLGPVPRLLVIEMESAPEPVAAYLGALRAGHPVLLLPPGAETRNAEIVATYRPDASYVEHDGSWRLDLAESAGGLHPDLALLLSTSGTTGAAKLVRLSLTAVDANAAAIAEYLHIDEHERAITSLPLFYSYGLSVLNSHLSRGAAVVLTPRSAIEPEFWTLLESQQATSIAGVPHSYELFEQAGLRQRDLPSLKTLTQAGGRLQPHIVTLYAGWAQATARRFFVMYGQTEATARMAYLPPDQVADHPDCIGVAIPGGRFDLIADDGAEIETPGQPGELVYTGPNVMMGYALARSDLANGPELKSLSTGDIAERTSDGLYRIVGRRSRFCKPFGLRVSLDELETALSKLGLSVAVTGDDDLIAVAYSGGLTPQDVRAELARRYELPPSLFDVVQLEGFPVLPSGKRDYRSIMEAARARRVESDTARASQSFATSFAALLNRRAVHESDSFESLEGDSLSYVSAATEIERRLGHLPEGWEQLSITELDRLARSAQPADRHWLRRIDTEVLLRALAICAVVITHTTIELGIGGGADALMILAGYSLARFDLKRLGAEGGWPVLRRFGARVILPYFLILIGYSALRKVPPAEYFLLLGNFRDEPPNFLTAYWFIQALAQTLLIVTLLFAVPAIRRLARERPWQLGLALLIGAVAVRVWAALLFQHDALNNRTPDATLPLFVLGFLCFLARTGLHRVLCLAATVLMCVGDVVGRPLPGHLSVALDFGHAGWILAAGIALTFVPRVALPRPLAMLVSGIAGISFTIYLLHMIPTHLLVEERWGPDWMALPLSLLLAAAVTWLVRRVRASWRSPDGLFAGLSRRDTPAASPPAARA